MSFRLRLTVLASLAVAVAVVATSVVIYYTDRHELVGEVDGELLSTQELPPLKDATAISLKEAASGNVRRVSFSGGNVVNVRGTVEGGPPLPGFFRVLLPKSSEAVQVRVTTRVAAPGAGTLPPRFATVAIAGVPYRQLTLFLPKQKVTIARSL